MFALKRDFASLYTLWGELSQNQLISASALSLPGKTPKTTTDQRNSSIVGSDDVHISSEIGENDMKVNLFYLIHPANSNSCENSGILVIFQCFLSNF